MKAIEVVVLALIAIVIALHLVQRILRRTACRAGAEKIYRDLNAMFAGEHQHRPGQREAFPDLDWPGYDAVRHALESLGFRALGAFEDVTVSEVHPENRTLIESYVSSDGMTGAGTYCIQGHQICDFATECEDGRFILTTNANLDKLTPPPTVDRCSLPEDTPVGVMFAKHRDRVTAARSTGTNHLSIQKTLDDAMDASRRYSRITSQYRQSVGLITEAELLALTDGPGQESAARVVWKEFRRLYEAHHRQRAA